MQKTLSFFALVLEKDYTAYCSQKLREIGLTQGLVCFIIYIGKCPDCSAVDLIKALHMDWGHTQRSIDRLVREGFVRKQKNKKDKRAYHLSLTAMGENAFSASHQVFLDWDKDVLQGVSDAEKEQLFTTLEKLIHRKGEFACVQKHECSD